MGRPEHQLGLDREQAAFPSPKGNDVTQGERARGQATVFFWGVGPSQIPGFLLPREHKREQCGLGAKERGQIREGPN